MCVVAVSVVPLNIIDMKSLLIGGKPQKKPQTLLMLRQRCKTTSFQWKKLKQGGTTQTLPYPYSQGVPLRNYVSELSHDQRQTSWRLGRLSKTEDVWTPDISESSDETPRGRKKQTVSSADFAFHVMHVFLHVQLICPAEDAPWYQSTDGRLILMTSASVAALLVLLLSMTVFLCRRAKRARTIKGPM